MGFPIFFYKTGLQRQAASDGPVNFRQCFRFRHLPDLALQQFYTDGHHLLAQQSRAAGQSTVRADTHMGRQRLFCPACHRYDNRCGGIPVSHIVLDDKHRAPAALNRRAIHRQLRHIDFISPRLNNYFLPKTFPPLFLCVFEKIAGRDPLVKKFQIILLTKYQICGII